MASLPQNSAADHRSPQIKYIVANEVGDSCDGMFRLKNFSAARVPSNRS